MSGIAIQGPSEDISQLESFLSEHQVQTEIFGSSGFDGASLATLVLDLSQILAPPVAAVFAAKVASKKAIVLKVKGIEVSAASKEEVLKVLGEVMKSGAGGPDVD